MDDDRKMYSPILSFPSAQGCGGTKMVTATSNGAREALPGLFGLREMQNPCKIQVVLIGVLMDL